MKQGLRVLCFASNQSFSFDVDPTDLATWCINCIIANVTYFRTRRELFDQLINLCMAQRVGSRVMIPEELFTAIKGFLTSRNESINDDKRLAFDKAVIELRNRAMSVSQTATFSSQATGVGVSGPASGAAFGRQLFSPPYTAAAAVASGTVSRPLGDLGGNDL